MNASLWFIVDPVPGFCVNFTEFCAFLHRCKNWMALWTGPALFRFGKLAWWGYKIRVGEGISAAYAGHGISNKEDRHSYQCTFYAGVGNTNVGILLNHSSNSNMFNELPYSARILCLLQIFSLWIAQQMNLWRLKLLLSKIVFGITHWKYGCSPNDLIEDELFQLDIYCKYRVITA